MLFTSLEFLYLFLPITISIYYLLKFSRDSQNLWLLIASLIFYAWGEPRFVFVMIGSIILNYIMAIFICLPKKRKIKKIILSFAIILNLGLIFIYKYSNFVTSIAREIIPSWEGIIPQTSFVLPIGISFFTFQSISYIIDVYRGVKVQKNPVNMALYIAMFPQLIAGPIVRYDTVAQQLSYRKESLTLFASGVERFLIGFSKKMLLANLFAITADKYFGSSDLSVCGAWFGAICYTFQIFFDFSGYSDMAIGLGRMFGFEFLENFNYPYISRSITEFWRRWHMSLGSWFRDYLYFPLGGSRVFSKTRLVFNLSIVWLATGVWHGANWTFILWGVLYGVLIIFEKLINWPNLVDKSKILGVVSWLVTIVFVVLGWVLFRSESIGFALEYISSMFGISATLFIDDKTIFEFREIFIVLIVGIIASVPIVPFVNNKLKRYQMAIGLLRIIAFVFLIAMFFVGVSYLSMNAHNPFIYFNF